MEKLVAKLFDLGGLPTKLVLVLMLCSGGVLFAPGPIAQRLHTQAFLTRYGEYVGITFILSAALLVTNLAAWGMAHVAGAVGGWRWKRHLRRQIGRLDPAERAVLREFFIQGKHALMMPLDDPTVAGLGAKGILVSVGTLGRSSIAGALFPLTMPSGLHDMLTYADLDLPTEDLTDEDRERLRRERPEFVYEMERHESLRRVFRHP